MADNPNNLTRIFIEERYRAVKHWPFGYIVCFEETTLMWCLQKQDAERIAGLLNAAFNLGKSTQVMWDDLRK